MGNAILKKFEDIKETMNCCSTNKTENIKDDEEEITLDKYIYKKGEENEYEIIEKITKEIIEDKERLEKDNADRAKAEMENAAIDAVIANTKIDVPEGIEMRE